MEIRKKRLAVIDLGTNTFTMLIAEVSDNQYFNSIFKERYFIKLAENGIETIGEKPYLRALDALINFKKSIDSFEVNVVRALGTAALRTASNGENLVAEIFQKTGIQVEIIDGDAEANYIYEGVKCAYPFGEHPDLIIDVGGGSVEFIIADKTEKLWAQSFPVGLAVLKKGFHQQEPIHAAEIEAIEQFLSTTLSPLFEAVKQYPIRNLIGASGTFDVFERLFLFRRVSEMATEVNVEDVLMFCESIIPLNSKERYANADIPDERVEMIIVAVILIRFVLQSFDIQAVGVSAYAMKEGLMSLLMKYKINSDVVEES